MAECEPIVAEEESIVAETRVVPVPFSMGPMTVNAYLLLGEGVVAVDTGLAGQQQRILDALAAEGREPTDVSLIVLTHGHGDHTGSAQALREATGARLAIGEGDEEKCFTGVDTELRGRNLASRSALKAMQWRQRNADPDQQRGPVADLVIQRDYSLEPHGVDAVIVPTPGHSRGSLSVFTADGDAIVGDLLGGGGRSRSEPQRGVFVCDEAAMDESIREIIARAPNRVFTGHDAQPFTLEQLKAAFPELM